MAFPQGINFRNTEAYRSGEDAASSGGNGWCYPGPSGGTQDYPQTTAQGNSVGWETSASSYGGRNRQLSYDVRLAGWGGDDSGTNVVRDFRVTLPAAGDYLIRMAMGDSDSAKDCDCEIIDTSSSLGVIISGNTGAASSYRDAGNNIRTHTAWPGSNSSVTKTFGTTICRFRVGLTTSTQSTWTAHIYIESAAASGIVIPVRMAQTRMRTN